ncbi:MAG TPA: flavodoxin family protein, partial [Candidatus Lokiarchaeia archaeon]|nr:flavodoxin family protein [Candidatus Lokiarchaeia archaeon]
MKILICYHSQTGNTEKVARAMAEALEGEDVTVLPARKVKPDSIGDYDLALLGSGVYGAQVGEPTRKLVKKATAFPPRCALFWTHA